MLEPACLWRCLLNSEQDNIEDNLRNVLHNSPCLVSFYYLLVRTLLEILIAMHGMFALMHIFL